MRNWAVGMIAMLIMLVIGIVILTANNTTHNQDKVNVEASVFIVPHAPEVTGDLCAEAAEYERHALQENRYNVRQLAPEVKYVARSGPDFRDGDGCAPKQPNYCEADMVRVLNWRRPLKVS